MNGVVAITDIDWFQFLAQQPALEEVNFWRPSDTRTPQQVRAGMPVIFKLRKRFGGWIVGWGVFARHDVLPAWLAWDAFEVRNGAASFAEMRQRIEGLRTDSASARVTGGDYEIGCLMLAEPVFLPRERWVRPPADWPDNVVQGKAYDLLHGEGARVWEDCRAAAGLDSQGVTDSITVPSGEQPRYGAPSLTRPRLGQGIFRLAVTSAYGRSCAVTSEHSLPALEAAHIRPYGEGGAHETSNGLLLRSDIHKLYDKGYVGVTTDLRFVVSDKLKDHFSNGKSYYPLHGKPIGLPEHSADRPNLDYLEWHLMKCFRG